jgi:malate dehydrogenase (quinone)
MVKDLFSLVQKFHIQGSFSQVLLKLQILKLMLLETLLIKLLPNDLNHLRTFYPEARDEDWQLYTAGKRVQVIKDTPEYSGKFFSSTSKATDTEVDAPGDSPNKAITE